MEQRAASQSPHLHGEEEDQARENAPLRALVIHEIIRAEGEAELERPVSAMVWSGLAAGLSMGFSFAVEALLRSDLGPGPGAHAVASLGYTTGFIIVVLGRQQLFTESTLSAVLPVLTRRDLTTALATARLWNVVFLANVIGTWLFAAAVAFGHPFRPEVTASLDQMARESVSQPFWNTLLRAVLAGWLIALMVWLLPSARSARFFVIGAITWVVAMARLSHVIAGSTEAAYATLTGSAGFGACLTAFLIPTLIGNTIGGVALVGMLNHAPVSAEMDVADEEEPELRPR